jgi:hypothetical protein
MFIWNIWVTDINQEYDVISDPGPTRRAAAVTVPGNEAQNFSSAFESQSELVDILGIRLKTARPGRQRLPPVGRPLVAAPAIVTVG